MESSLHDRRQLLRKYNVAAPRYTSYPTVPYWETTPNEQEWLSALAENLSSSDHASSRGMALYLHIPFCERLCTFCGCNTRITRHYDVAVPYVDTILMEWQLYREKLSLLSNARLGELHLGGGTPTFLKPQELYSLISSILQHVSVDSDAEFSIEVDPRVTTYEQLKVLRELGFRRVSLGVQDFDANVQAAVNRHQTIDQVRKIVDDARGLGYNSVNFDLIYGLPMQTLQSMRETFEKVVELRPDRIAFYAYAHVPWIKPLHRKFTDADLPAPELKRQLYEIGREMLEDCGYREVGMDHFALPTDGLWRATVDSSLHRNFMGYTSHHVSPLLGLGVSSISDAWSAFIQNEKSLEAYRARVLKGELPIFRGHMLTEEDRSIRRHILSLMTKFQTEWDDDDCARDFLATVPQKLSELVSDGICEVDQNKILVREEGRPFIRNIGMAIDARLARRAPETSLFSKSI